MISVYIILIFLLHVQSLLYPKILFQKWSIFYLNFKGKNGSEEERTNELFLSTVVYF